MEENKNTLVDVSDLGLSEEELFSHLDISELESERITAPRYSYWKSVFRSFFRKKINTFVLIVMALIIIFAYIYPMVIRFDPDVSPYQNVNETDFKHLNPAQAIKRIAFGGKDASEMSFGDVMKSVGESVHWLLGSGSYGQSTFDTIWYGSSISISLAFVCAAINLTIGIIIGAIWGFSKKVDIIMTEVFNIVGNVPYILIISVLVLVLKRGFWTMAFALTITGWIAIAYFIRTQVVIIRDREYNLASRCLGTPILRLTTKNILPFMTSVIVTLAATEIPTYISYEVYLSYIGIGMKENSLGKIIEAAQEHMYTYAFEYWSPVIVASIITVILYLVGQNLGDASDPKTHM